MPIISIYGLISNKQDQKRKFCASAQGVEKDSNKSKLISVPIKQLKLMSPASRRNMDNDDEQFSPVKSENIVDDEEENISQKVSNLKLVG